MFFPTAGISAPFWLPPTVGFILAFFCSMVGISGAFLLLPFQMSVLGYVSPSVSATNLVFNLVAIPGGIWRYAREKRMDWRLARIIAVGTLPGLLAGWWLRLNWLAEPKTFKLFVGGVLAWLALRLFRQSASPDSPVTSLVTGRTFPEHAIFLLSVGIGLIGGAYGIGGGALMAPTLIAVFGFPVQTVAGAALFGTLVTSVAGVLIYQFLPTPTGAPASPDWLLGLLFGAGGLIGMYLGARTQKHISSYFLKRGLALVLAALAAGYVLQIFR